MNQQPPIHWIITGATSAIAKAICYQVADTSPGLITLVGRDQEELERTQCDLALKYNLTVEYILCDFNQTDAIPRLLSRLVKTTSMPTTLILMHCLTYNNDELDREKISNLVHTNVTTTCQLTHWFVHHHSQPQRLLYISSVAADRGRPINSLYGASKRFVELYLEGLRPQLAKKVAIYIIRLGWIDTHQTFALNTYGLAASPQSCAKACLKLLNTSPAKRRYFPRFWYAIMYLVRRLPEKWLIKLG